VILREKICLCCVVKKHRAYRWATQRSLKSCVSPLNHDYPQPCWPPKNFKTQLKIFVASLTVDRHFSLLSCRLGSKPLEGVKAVITYMFPTLKKSVIFSPNLRWEGRCVCCWPLSEGHVCDLPTSQTSGEVKRFLFLCCIDLIPPQLSQSRNPRVRHKPSHD
jgi:hypothetical protein